MNPLETCQMQITYVSTLGTAAHCLASHIRLAAYTLHHIAIAPMTAPQPVGPIAMQDKVHCLTSSASTTRRCKTSVRLGCQAKKLACRLTRQRETRISATLLNYTRVLNSMVSMPDDTTIDRQGTDVLAVT
jgi:hypothetical protein